MKQFKMSMSLAMALFMFGLTATAGKTLDAIIGEKGEMFEVKADSFMKGDNKPLFRWLSDKKDDAHYPGWGNSPSIKFFGFPVQDANLRFNEGLLSSVYVSIYNRGDAGDISQDAFNRMTGELGAKLGEWTGDKGSPVRKSKLGSEAIAQERAWVKDTYAVVMKWSYSKGRSKKDLRPEYIQVEISRFDPKNDPRKQNSSTPTAREKMASSKSILDNVKKEDNGDVFIDNFPMVDQGQKGYCAVASTERILKYYNVDATQHDLAQIADSSASGGTSLRAMMESVKRAGVKFGVKMREHYQACDSVGDIEKAVKKYNKYAKKLKKREISMVVEGNCIEVGATMAQMDSEVIKGAKCEGDKNGEKNFLKDIREHVNKGIPLLWGVTLGIIKEGDGPQSFGGHMRSIIGYNDKDKKIIYTDSWGAGHEFKKMDYDDAWTMTDALLSLDPRKK